MGTVLFLCDSILLPTLTPPKRLFIASSNAKRQHRTHLCPSTAKDELRRQLLPWPRLLDAG